MTYFTFILILIVLIDKIALTFNKTKNSPEWLTPINYFLDNDFKSLNTKFESFKLLDNVEIDSRNSSEVGTMMEFCKNLPIRINRVYLNNVNLDSFESLTNPELFKHGVNEIWFAFYDYYGVSPKTFENLQVINPQKITGNFHSMYCGGDYDKIFTDYSKLIFNHRGIPIAITMNYIYSCDIFMSFKNPTIKVNLKGGQSKFIKCTSFRWGFDYGEEMGREFLFPPLNLSSPNTKDKFLYLYDVVNLNILNSTVITDPEEIKQAELLFLACTSSVDQNDAKDEESENEGEGGDDYDAPRFIVPLRYCHKVELSNNFNRKFNAFEGDKCTVDGVFCTNNIELELDFKTQPSLWKRILDLYPSSTVYKLKECGQEVYFDNFNQDDEDFNEGDESDSENYNQDNEDSNDNENSMNKK